LESEESLGEVINVPNAGDFASENDEFVSCNDNAQDIATSMAEKMGMDIDINNINVDVDDDGPKVPQTSKASKGKNLNAGLE